MQVETVCEQGISATVDECKHCLILNWFLESTANFYISSLVSNVDNNHNEEEYVCRGRDQSKN